MSSPNHYHLAHLKIPLENIISATNNFDDENLIQEADFANAYTGELLWSGELIDISARRFNKEYEGSDKLFWTEVSMLSSLRHQNLISFVGFCDENGEKIVISKHETRGRLDDYLSDPFSLLTWVQRLKISVGLAHALSYIHYDEPRDFSVIHRSINSTAVLLNDNLEPKLSEFTISVKVPASQRHHSFHTDEVRATSGYTDPIYEQTDLANYKSDMHSFGIVLFELLCGREFIIDSKDDNHLVPLAITYYREKKLNEIIDFDLENQMYLQSFDIFAETAYDCWNEERSQPPNIDDIVARLEKALELQLEFTEMELTLIGLQDAGKTSLVNSIVTGGYSEDMIPTVGFNMRKVIKGNVKIKLFDLGGQQRFRNSWERYCRGVAAILYLVDAADWDSIPIAKTELHNLLTKPSINGIPLLVLGNKIDKSQALTKQALVDQLGLDTITDREVCCYMISCKDSVNIDMMIDWLIKHYKKEI